jgi:endonuclease YncB( thermonuclease family)
MLHMVLQYITAFLLLAQNFFAFGAAPVPVAPQSGPIWATTTGQVTHVVDGDTIDVTLSD